MPELTHVSGIPLQLQGAAQGDGVVDLRVHLCYRDSTSNETRE
jgi:hypothetical protein